MSTTYSSEIIYSYIDFDGKLDNVIKKIYINGKTKLIQQLAKIKTSQAWKVAHQTGNYSTFIELQKISQAANEKATQLLHLLVYGKQGKRKLA